ncbi:MAG: hypothetical protein ABIO70_19020 [Pseudomonadota bacterium]
MFPAFGAPPLLSLPTRIALLLLLLLAAAALPLIWSGPEPLLAWGGAEVWGHLWTWWWHGAALPAWPAGTDLALGTEQWPVIDPLPAALGALLFRLGGPSLAWDALALAAMAGAFLGGAFAARRAGGDPLVGGLVLAMGPIFTGGLLSGLSEDMALGLLAVAAGLLLQPAPAGSPPPRTWPVAAGLTLGLLAWCGPYLAFLGAAVALGAGAIALVRRPRAWRPWALAATIALLLALPSLLAQGSRALTGTGHHAGALLEQVEPLWRVNPWGAADLASFFAPGHAPLPPDAVVRLHPAYLGLLVLGLAALGGRSRWWWLLAAAVLVAPGDRLHLLGHPTGLPNPFSMVLGWLPLAARLNHHARLLLLGQVALAVLAARGTRRLGRFAPLALLAVVLDYGLLAPVPWPLPCTSAAAPAVVAELAALPPGGLVVVPAGGPGLSPQRPLLDQRVHGRRLALAPNHPGPPNFLNRSPLGRWLASMGRGPEPPPPTDLDPGALIARSYPVLLVLGPTQIQVERHLGPPDLASPEAAAWDLTRLAASPPDMLPAERTP